MTEDEIQNAEIQCWTSGPFCVMECPDKEVYDYVLNKIREQTPEEHRGKIIYYEKKLRVCVMKDIAQPSLLRAFGELLVRSD